MAEFMNISQVRNYELSNGTTVDLAALISVDVPADWRTPDSLHELAVGQVAYVPAMGHMRRGVVSKIGRTKATVTFTTQGTVDEGATSAARGGAGAVRVQSTTADVAWIKVAPVPTVEQDIERVTAGQVRMATVVEPMTETEEMDQELAFETVEISDALMTPASEQDSAPATGSTVVQMLEQVWTAIQANHPELPDVVIVTGSAFQMKSSRWGHHRPNGWDHKDAQVQDEGMVTNLSTGEMFIAGETLAKGAAFTLETMLHEAGHALARVRDIQDTSRQNRWHNQAFRKLSEELGLEYAKDKADPQHGYSDVTLTPGTIEEYAELIADLDKAIRLTVAIPAFLTAITGGQQAGGGEYVHGGRRPRGEASATSSNNVKCVCRCEEPRIIRMSRKVLEEAGVMCRECGQDFEAA